MSQVRRNTITYNDAIAVAVVAALSAVAAVFSDASPTGTTGSDIVLVAALAGFVTWLGATAPWWALMTGAGIALVGALPGPFVWIILATVAFTASAWIGWDRANQPIVRSVIAAIVVQVSLRLEWDEFFLWSAIIAAAAMGTVGLAGCVRRRKYVRKRIKWAALGVGALAVIAVAGLAVAAGNARNTARDGYLGLLDGLEFLQDGKVSEASATLTQASADLADAEKTLNSPLTQLARFVPGIAQNRNVGVDVLADAAVAADSAATTLQFVDLDQLTVSNGVVDIGALAALEAPLKDLEETVSELSDTLDDAESDWLVAPLQSRLDTGIRRADQAAHQARATAAAARIGPAVLGADEPRTYLLAFVNSAEARGTSGLMGNWSEITVDNGRIEVTNSGRTADLQLPGLSSLELDMPDEYLQRYIPYGAQVRTGEDLDDIGVAQKYWANVTIPADMPSVGAPMAQMYEAATGRAVDGVFVIDPAGVAGLLEITGAVELPDIGQRVDSGNAQEFLTLGQYEFAENEREDLLTAVTDATVDNVLNSTLPPPQQMAAALAPAVLNGHISGWVADPAEQELLDLVGMDGALPRIRVSGQDALAVVNINRNANKIDSFLERTIEYRPVVNQRTGATTATLTISMTNTAPTTGYDDYVIGNQIDLPTGTNRTILDVYTRLGVDAARLDGEDTAPYTVPELGYNVLTTVVEIPPGETVVMELELSGDIGRGPYQLLYRPQPLPNPETLTVDARTTGGDEIFEFEGTLERRSVLDADGVNAWR
jgi:hypothetical protein